MDRTSVARNAGLLVVVFVATFVLLVGGWAIISRFGTGTGAAGPSASPGAFASGSPGVPPSGSPGILPSGSAATPGVSPSLPTGGPPVAVDPRASDAPTIVLTGAGDIADCGSDGSAKTAALLEAQEGWFFTAGDNAYANGSLEDYQRCYDPTWGRFLDRTILPAPGNHDWDTKHAAGYRAYYGDRATPNGDTWYSMDAGTWHIVVLDSDCDGAGGCRADSPQGRWLAADLRAHPAFCTMAIWHEPRFSSGEHGNDASVRFFWEQLAAADAELIVNGHDHDYERFAPQDPNGHEQRPGGIREIVAGTGGGKLRAFQATQPNSEFRLSGTWGVLRLTLHPFNYDWEFLPTDGDIADSGSTACH